MCIARNYVVNEDNPGAYYIPIPSVRDAFKPRICAVELINILCLYLNIYQTRSHAKKVSSSCDLEFYDLVEQCNDK